MEAFSIGEARSLTYRYPTDEGQIIEVNLAVLARGVVEARTDREDEGRGITTQRCSGLELVEGGIFEVSNCM
jgi:hypothetical protein